MSSKKERRFRLVSFFRLNDVFTATRYRWNTEGLGGFLYVARHGLYCASVRAIAKESGRILYEDADSIVVGGP